MLEIPESNTIARQLRDAVCGKTIKYVEAAGSPHGFAWYFGEPSAYPSLLCGKRMDDARAIAGYVEIKVQEARILINDGVNVRYFDMGAPLPKKHQLLVEFEDNSSLVCTIRMYGGIYAYPDGAFENTYFSVAKNKPSPLSDEFSRECFDRIYDDTPSKLSVKALLATEQRIPGVGNGCLQDILFMAKINPLTKISALTNKDLDVLYKSTRKTLSCMIAKGGRDTEKDLFGCVGGYQTVLSSKTYGQACPRCGMRITRKAYLGGNVYFCSMCQPVASAVRRR